MAILVSIVDTAAAHELLSRLPAESAQKVLSALSNLGPVSDEEKSQVLQLVQSNQFGLGPSSTDRALEESVSDSAEINPYEDEEDEELAADPNSIWAQLDLKSIVEFVRHERPAVIAVVLSQLSAKVAVKVLQELGTNTSGDAMRCLARMQDVDPATRQALDEYIKERLGEAQLDLLPVPKYSKRVEAMLSMASEEWRETWKEAIRSQPRNIQVISDDGVSAKVPQEDQLTRRRSGLHNQQRADDELRPIPGTIVQFEKPPNAEVKAARNPNLNVDAYQELVAQQAAVGAASSAHSNPTQANPIHGVTDVVESTHASVEKESTDAAEVVSIPFPKQPERQVVDRTFLQLEFEKVLTLTPAMIAELMSSVAPQTVLLALAGAPPKWMKRFYKMLDRRDAKMLEQKLRSIGSIKISDIDVAQSKIVDRAHELRVQAGSFNTDSVRAAA